LRQRGVFATDLNGPAASAIARLIAVFGALASDATGWPAGRFILFVLVFVPLVIRTLTKDLQDCPSRFHVSCERRERSGFDGVARPTSNNDNNSAFSDLYEAILRG
jgi:hypothetical protein